MERISGVPPNPTLEAVSDAIHRLRQWRPGPHPRRGRRLCPRLGESCAWPFRRARCSRSRDRGTCARRFVCPARRSTDDGGHWQRGYAVLRRLCRRLEVLRRTSVVPSRARRAGSGPDRVDVPSPDRRNRAGCTVAGDGIHMVDQIDSRFAHVRPASTRPSLGKHRRSSASAVDREQSRDVHCRPPRGTRDRYLANDSCPCRFRTR